jgi:hypothetical protein
VGIILWLIHKGQTQISVGILANVHGGSFLYLVTGGLKDGSAWVDLYQVSLDRIINGSGLVTIDGSTTISAMNVFGNVPVPETVNTGALLFFTVLGLLLTYEVRRRRVT